jgi:protein TonB
MANTLIPPEIDPSHEAPQLRPVADAHMDELVIEEQGVFGSLWSNVRDVFFPVKLPPLVLESKPIPVIDRMATKQNPKATGASVAIYALLILLAWWIIKKHVGLLTPPKPGLRRRHRPKLSRWAAAADSVDRRR